MAWRGVAASVIARFESIHARFKTAFELIVVIHRQSVDRRGEQRAAALGPRDRFVELGEVDRETREIAERLRMRDRIGAFRCGAQRERLFVPLARQRVLPANVVDRAEHVDRLDAIGRRVRERRRAEIDRGLRAP